MSTIVTRAGKGAPLTHTEVDANFTNLNTDKLEVGAAFNAAVAATPAVTANTAKVTNATHTGDVTGATALTIANDAVTNAKAADMAANTIKGRATAGTGDPEDLTGTQATALLDAFVGSGVTHKKGLVPDPGATPGTVKYLREDGTWEVPPGTSGSPTESFIIAIGDQTTALTTGTAKETLRMPYGFTLTAVRASLTTAQASGSIFTVDINENGSTILSTKLTIDNTEKTSTTAATAAVISDANLADDAEITIDIDQIGDGTAKALKVVLIGYRT